MIDQEEKTAETVEQIQYFGSIHKDLRVSVSVLNGWWQRRKQKELK